ncbi:MAG TPA: hypothetical protein PLY80_00395 [Pseudomonadota bacterium]|nr:hypothetical protein [Pseudomonadota bacterium]
MSEKSREDEQVASRASPASVPDWLALLTAPERARAVRLCPPFEPLGPMTDKTRARLTEESLRVNDRYLREFIEGSSFCPYARQGRRAGQTQRHVYLAETLDLAPLLQLFLDIAADPTQVVAQVIMPVIEAEPEAWRRFCLELTELGHARLKKPVLACAPLHPKLPFVEANMYGLVPLFRRAPDPTIQWVRLDGLEALYAGRGSDNQYLQVQDIESFVRSAQPPRPPLYDVVCKTNAAMARRLTIERVVKTLDEIASDGRRSYAQILLEDESQAAADRGAADDSCCASVP